MRLSRQTVFLLFWCLFAGAIPAYANNPPLPDGMLSLILIFPVAILGFRMAGARPSEKQYKWRLLTGLVLGLCVLLSAAGTGIALIPLLVILAYGVRRGIQAMHRGQGKKRLVLGSLVILFTLFGIANYLASLNYGLTGPSLEGNAVSTLRVINVVEQEFQSNGTLDVNKNNLGEFGTLEQLHRAGLLDDMQWQRMQRPFYRYVVVLSGDPALDEKHYFVYATPVNYGSQHFTLSIIRSFLPSAAYARRTFASDESGVIRAQDRGNSRPVTRAEAEKWPQL